MKRGRPSGVWYSKIKRTFIRLYDPKPDDIKEVLALCHKINTKNKQLAVEK